MQRKKKKKKINKKNIKFNIVKRDNKQITHDMIKIQLYNLTTKINNVYNLF